MAIAIKASASSTLRVNGSGISISTSSHTNTGVTSAQAPVLLTVQADRIVTATEFAAMVASANTDMTSAFVARILNALSEAVADIVDQESAAPTIDLGWGKFVFEIAGSLLTATQTPTALDNPCYFSGQIHQKYQRQFAQIKATATQAENPCGVSRVRDKGTGDPNTIYGNDPFLFDGWGLVWGAATVKQELYDELGLTKKCDLQLATASSYANSMQLTIPTNLPQGLPAGRYSVVVTCTIGGTAYPLAQKVTLAEAVAPVNPTITKVTQDGRPDNTVLLGPNPWTINGTGLARQTGDEVWVELYSASDPTERIDEGDNTELVTSWTDTAITISRVKTNTRQPDGSWWEAYPRSMVVFIRGGVRHEFPMTFIGG